MAIKNLESLLERFKKGEVASSDDFEKELNKLLPEDWMPKSTYNELNDKYKLSEKQLKETTEQLSELNNKAGLADEYKAQIDKLTESQKAEKEGFEKQIAEMRHGYALDAALTAAKARNVKAVKAMLDMDKITWEGDAIKGLDDQLKAIRESDGYLFEQAEDSNQTPPRKPTFSGTNPKGNDPQAPSGLEAAMMKAAGLS